MSDVVGGCRDHAAAVAVPHEGHPFEVERGDRTDDVVDVVSG
jgi:hypothetical protein